MGCLQGYKMGRNPPPLQPQKAILKVLAGGGLAATLLSVSGPLNGRVEAAYLKETTPSAFLTAVERAVEAPFALEELTKGQSPGWELARQKRTAAIKLMEEKKMLRVETDEKGNQYLSLPWIPDKRIKYKSLDLSRRLTNEACAGALGEITKDALLYSVDTRKTRAQIKKASVVEDLGEGGDAPPAGPGAGLAAAAVKSAEGRRDGWGMDPALDLPDAALGSLQGLKELYSGFPVVLASSIPQGAIFFLAKGGLLEAFNQYLPGLPEWTSSIIPIVLGTMVYWIIRTPAEVIKTKVQAAEFPDVTSAFESIRDTEGVPSLWKFYSVMLSLDVPFQVINFILYGFLADVVVNAGVEQNVLTRLGVGIGCGMVAAAVTCPLDVVKTRIQTKVKASAAPSTGTVMPRMEAVVDLGGMPSSSSRAAASVNEDGGRVGLLESSPVPVSAMKGDGMEECDDGGAELNTNVATELADILRNEGVGALFLGLQQRVLYTGLANGLRFAAYGTSRMDLMMRSLDDL